MRVLEADERAQTKTTTQPAVRAEGRSPRRARSPPAWRIETRASELRRRSRARVDGPGWWGSGRRTSCQLESASRRAQTCRRLGWRLWVPKRKHSMSTRRRRLKPRHGGRGQVVTVRTATDCHTSAGVEPVDEYGRPTRTAMRSHQRLEGQRSLPGHSGGRCDSWKGGLGKSADETETRELKKRPGSSLGAFQLTELG